MSWLCTAAGIKQINRLQIKQFDRKQTVSTNFFAALVRRSFDL